MIDKNCYDLLRVVFNKDDLDKMKIDKKHFITKELLTNINRNDDPIIFICQPKINIMEIIYQLSLMFENIEINLIFIPSETYEIIKFIDFSNLNHRFQIYNFNMDLIPLDNDLISLEKENSFKQLYLEKDITQINDLVNAFIKLEACFGKIKYKYIKGSRAKIFNDLLIKKEKESNMKKDKEIFGMIVFDRNVDFITPLTSNYTYEGLIDEYFGINKNNIIIDESYFKEKGFESQTGNKMIYNLSSSNNEFYSRIRCMNYLDAHKYIHELKKYFSDKAKENKGKINFQKMKEVLQDMNTFASSYKGPIIINTNFVSKIFNENIKDDNTIYRQKESFFLSGNYPENMDTYYSDYMSEKKDLINLINLLCIESLTQGGIKGYNKLKRDILNIYGSSYIFLFKDLEKIGLIQDKDVFKKSGEASYEEICSKLNLVGENIQKNKIEDCSYIYQGYCPIILRLIERALEGKWNKLKDVINKLPGDTIYPPNENEIFKNHNNKNVNTIFVVFIGGATYTEIEGIRYINLKLKQMYDSGKNKNMSRTQLIVVTNEILNKKKIFNSLGKKFKQSYTLKKYYMDNLKNK